MSVIISCLSGISLLRRCRIMQENHSINTGIDKKGKKSCLFYLLQVVFFTAYLSCFSKDKEQLRRSSDGTMKRPILPKTKQGTWAAALAIIFIIFILMKMMGLMPLPTFFIAAIGLAGFIMGIIALIRNGERALLNYLPLVAGLIILLWIAAELLFPH